MPQENPDLYFSQKVALHLLVSVNFWMDDRGSTLIVGARHMRRYRRWRAELSRAMFGFLKQKQIVFFLGANIAHVVRRTSSVTRRLNHVNIHRFWARRPVNSDSRRLRVCLGESEVLTKSN